MRIRTAALAVLLATAAVSWTPVTASAAPCSGLPECDLELTVSGPLSMGIGAVWSAYPVELSNPGADPMSVETFAVEMTTEGVANLGARLQHRADGAWTDVAITHQEAGESLALVDVDVDLPAGQSTTVDLRLTVDAPPTGVLLGGDPADIAAARQTTLDADVTVTALGPELPGLLETDRTEFASDTHDTAVMLLHTYSGVSWTATVGEPVVTSGAVANDTDSDYEQIVVVPWRVPGSDGTPATTVEVRVGGTWVPYEDAAADGRLRGLAVDIGSGDSRLWDYRFTFHDEDAVEDGVDGIVWAAMRHGPGTEIGTPYPDVQNVGATATLVTVVDAPPSGTPTPTSTDDDASTPSASPAGSEGGDDPRPRPTGDDGGNDDEDDGTDGEGGEGAGGELAETGFDLTGRGAAGTLLLILGALVVVATLRRRDLTQD